MYNLINDKNEPSYIKGFGLEYDNSSNNQMEDMMNMSYMDKINGDS